MAQQTLKSVFLLGVEDVLGRWPGDAVMVVSPADRFGPVDVFAGPEPTMLQQDFDEGM
jgi:hypothetical protein